MEYFTSETLEAFLIKDPNKFSLSEKGKKLLRNSHIYNIDKWGKDESHNILYITGYSGSGKSTLATYFKDSNTDLIHLDLYFEKNEIQNESQNTNFNEYLKSKGIKPINMVSKDQWVKTQVFSKFEKAIEDFAKEQFHKGRKVIAEGIQIYDESLWEDKSHYKDKPLIIVKTNAITSVNRAMNRDGGKFKSIPQVKEYISWYSSANKQIKNLDKNAK